MASEWRGFVPAEPVFAMCEELLRRGWTDRRIRALGVNYNKRHSQVRLNAGAAERVRAALLEGGDGVEVVVEAVEPSCWCDREAVGPRQRRDKDHHIALRERGVHHAR